MKISIPAIFLGVGLAGLVACSGDGPTRATPPPVLTYVSVAGNYAGTFTQTLTASRRSVSCPASTTASQSQDRVIFTPLILGAPCPSTPQIHLPPLVIDVTGRIPSYPQTLAVTEDCGDEILNQDGGFSGNEFRLTMAFTAVSSACVSRTIAIQVTKQ